MNDAGDLSRRLDALSPEKRALLERALLAGRRRSGADITPRDRSQPAPVSATQARMWFHDQFAPGSTAYNAVIAFWLDGHVDVDLLEAAVRDSVARHEIIRSVVHAPAGVPVQTVLTPWAFAIDRRTAAEDDDAVATVRAVAAAPFDLTRDLALRVVVVEVAATRHLVAFCEHHIAFDGWSDEILFDEVTAYYDTGGTVAREPLRLQFADFAAWQHARLEAGALEAHVQFWQRTLRGAAPVLDLPLDTPRGDTQSFRGRRVPVALDRADAVRQLRAEFGGTDFVILVAAWIVVLYRWSGTSDIVLATPMANRSRLELEPLIGFFANTVPLRVQVDAAQTFGELVRRVSAATLDAYDHQEVPFERIVDAVLAERDPRVGPLAQANVRVVSGPQPHLRLAGTKVEPVDIDLGFARFDLAVEFHVTDERIGGYLEYNEALFSEATMTSLLERMDAVLAALSTQPSLAVWDVPQPTARTRSRMRGAR